MNITILNGNPDRQNQDFDRYLDLYKVKMHNTEHYVRSFMLREMKITDLRSAESGQRWLTIPKLRMISGIFSTALDETDLLIIASPLEQGFLSILTKMIMDRLTKVLQPSQY